MNRTVLLSDNWYFYKDKKPRKRAGGLFISPVDLPVKENEGYTICRKFICPKQINDTVTVFFEGSFREISVYASGVKLTEEKDENGRTVYDVTSALRKGSTVICAVCDGGNTDAFYFRVKRKE